MLEFELEILDYIQHHLRGDIFDAIFPVITFLGNSGLIWIVLAIVLMTVKKTRKTGHILGYSLVLVLLICVIILKPVMQRLRPYTVKDMALIISEPSGYSFPSGHTASSIAACTALFLTKSKLFLPSCIVGILISFSRMYLYVHYPTDILGGILAGILSGMLGYILFYYTDRLYNNRKLKINK